MQSGRAKRHNGRGSQCQSMAKALEIKGTKKAGYEEYENTPSANNDNEPTPRHRQNPNIVKDPIIVKAKGVGKIGSSRDAGHGEAPTTNVKRTRICRICHRVGHDARNREKRPPSRRQHLRPSSSTISSYQMTGAFAFNASTQDSFHSSEFMS
ncbi:hypothetical protein PanWU01x14_013190 [Parasponia andersonii]|uniref:Uncharacterized protein n=1 Tax=Parasponia andersonii TaxID=3476 RepID=A0A2P5E0Y7_PARAD|nr:hypothetical protein PanWU01x14_013190 [Parasponia andersonii]